MSLIPLGFWAASGGGAAGAFELLETTTLTSSASSVTFTGLDSYSDYKHLQIRSVQRGVGAFDAVANLYVRLNSDTGNNYAWHQLSGNGSTVASQTISSTNIIQLKSALPLANSTSDSFGASVIDILDFSDTSKNTTLRALTGTHTASNKGIGLSSGLWVDTSAVTAIQLYYASNLATGSRFSLYGVK